MTPGARGGGKALARREVRGERLGPGSRCGGGGVRERCGGEAQ